MLSFFTSKVGRIGLGVVAGIMLISIPYCIGHRNAERECKERALKDLIERQERYEEVKEDREEKKNEIIKVIESGSATDEYKSRILSSRPYSS